MTENAVARLKCVSQDAAENLAKECNEAPGAGPSNTVAVDGDTLVITYFDKRWPLDIADFASIKGIATDSEAARVMACL